MLTDLDLINACLGTMGTAPVDSSVQQRVSAAALKAYTRQSKRIQGMRWFFNTKLVTLPVGVITSTYPILTAIASGGSPLFVGTDNIARDSLGAAITTPTLASVTYEIPMPQLIQMAAQAIFDAAVLEFQKNFAEDAAMTAKLEQIATQSYAVLAEENMRAILNGNTYYQEPV